MMISDVPGLTWGVVPALAQNGVKYISNGPNANWANMDGDRIGYVRVQWEHNPFYWQSPSGREKVLYWARRAVIRSVTVSGRSWSRYRSFCTASTV